MELKLSRQETPNSVYKIVHKTLQRWSVTKDDRDTTDHTEHACTTLDRAFFFPIAQVESGRGREAADRGVQKLIIWRHAGAWQHVQLA